MKKANVGLRRSAKDHTRWAQNPTLQKTKGGATAQSLAEVESPLIRRVREGTRLAPITTFAKADSNGAQRAKSGREPGAPASAISTTSQYRQESIQC